MKNLLVPTVILILLVGGYYLYHSVSNTAPAYNGYNDSATTLDLSNRGLTEVSGDVFNKTSLEELDLSHNALDGALQSQIGQLKNLKILNLSNNNFTGVPAEIGQLSNLEVLDLSNNEITGLPFELGKLQNLKTLNLSGNKYSEQDLEKIQKELPSSVQIIK